MNTEEKEGSQTPGGEPLSQQAARGYRWSAVSSAGITAIQVVQILILPRLILPAEYGMASAAQMVSGFALAFADLGMSAMVIRRRDATREQLSRLYLINFVAGIVATVLVVLSGPALAWYFEEDRLRTLVWWVALPLVIAPLGQQFGLLFQRELRFQFLASIDITATAAGFLVALGAAMQGYSAEALLWGPLTTVTVRSVVLAITGVKRWPLKFTAGKVDLSGFLSFGAFQVGERMINFMTSRADQFVIGGALGSRSLGHFNLAYQYSMLPLGRVNSTLNVVAFPVFARLQHDREAIRDRYLELMGVIMLINAPLMSGLAAVARHAVPVLAGNGWEETVLPLMWLCMAAMVRSHANPVGALLAARGRADLGFYWNVVLFFVEVPVVIIAASFGDLSLVAASSFVLQVLYAPLNYWFLVRPNTGPCLRSYVWAIARPGAAALCMGLAVAAADRWLLDGFGHIFALVVLVTMGVLLYTGLILLFLPDSARRARQLLLGR